MTDAAGIIEQLINSEGIHPFVLICEAVDKYMPIVDSITVALENGQTVRVADMDKDIAVCVEEARKFLRREDRIIWALRFFKKALIEQLLWMIQNEPQFFVKKFGSPAAQEQPGLMKQLHKLKDVDILPFQEFDPNDMDSRESPYSGFAVIDAITERLGHFIKAAATHGEKEAGNIINTLRLDRQSFGEVVAAYRRGEIEMLRRYAGTRHIWKGPGGTTDLQDECGPIQTLVKFPNGWRWLNLHRQYGGAHMDDPGVASNVAVTGHCSNRFKLGEYSLELVEPLGSDRWRHHAFFVVHRNGIMGEMKGRKNQKPSPRLHRYILELLRQYPAIKGFKAGGGHAPENDFDLGDFPEPYRDTLKKERPELFGNSIPQDNDEDGEPGMDAAEG